MPTILCLVIATLCASALPARSQPVEQLPIHIVYVNHVEVESVIEYDPPLVDGQIYSSTLANHAYTSGQIDWEIAQAEAVGAYISFHMSGAYAERAVDAGQQALWAQRLAGDHTVGIHFHKFLRGPNAFEWISLASPTQAQVTQAWQDNYDLAASLVGGQALWVGESHYGCPTCWQTLGYRLKATEQMALLPVGQHIVWLVERDPTGGDHLSALPAGRPSRLAWSVRQSNLLRPPPASAQEGVPDALPGVAGARAAGARTPSVGLWLAQSRRRKHGTLRRPDSGDVHLDE